MRGKGYASMELFAHENGIPKSTLSEILTGKNDPKLSTLAKISAGLEIPLSELLRTPEIELWVREVAPEYDARTSKTKTKTGTRSAGKKSRK